MCMRFSVVVLFLLSIESGGSVLEEIVVTATRFNQQTGSLATNIATIDDIFSWNALTILTRMKYFRGLLASGLVAVMVKKV